MKPIETNFRGYRFRSRLEARWAVFFDHVGMNWEYEPEGFELPSGVKYLPDFRITAHGVTFWVEVKPRHTDSDPKFDEFAGMVDCAILASGDPIDALNGRNVCPRCGSFHKDVTTDANGSDTMTICFPCDLDTPCGGYHPTHQDGAMGTPYRPHKGWIMCDMHDHRQLLQKYAEAAQAARAARFEHGEVPA